MKTPELASLRSTGFQPLTTPGRTRIRVAPVRATSTFAGVAARAAILLAFLAIAGVPASAQDVDPPGFAAVSLKGTQVIRLNVVCFDHEVGTRLPSRCRGELMFHDAAGRELRRGSYDLPPGEAMFLQLAIPAVNAAGESIRRVTIVPCFIPAPGGRAVPTVEVFDREAGRVILFENPAARRMSEFNNSLRDPGSLAGFDPQPDPPGFGVATLRVDQTLRLNVACFEHPINGLPARPCRGIVMFHDTAGNVLRRAAYEIEPGRTQSVEFAPPATITGGTFVGIVPCVLPDPGGRAVPNLEVMDNSGNVVLLINPAASRMSQFQQQELLR